MPKHAEYRRKGKRRTWRKENAETQTKNENCRRERNRHTEIEREERDEGKE